MSINFSLRKYSNPVFIETGTFQGAGIRRALYAGFKKIYSIEISERYYKESCDRFKREIGSGRVEIVHGDSSECLGRIIDNIHCEITFWLDAHYSSGGTAKGKEDVPILSELEAISEHPVKTHSILVDDVRLFGTNNAENWSNITKPKIIAKLREINEHYEIFYESGLIKDDVLVAEIKRMTMEKIIGYAEDLVIKPHSYLLRKSRQVFHG